MADEITAGIDLMTTRHPHSIRKSKKTIPTLIRRGTLLTLLLFGLANCAHPSSTQDNPVAQRLSELADPIERQNFILSLSYQWNDAAITTVTRALDDPDPIVRYAAVTVLGDAGDTVPLSTLQALANHLQDSDPWVRDETIAALQRLTDVAFPRYSTFGLQMGIALVNLSKHHDPFTRSKAIAALEPWEHYLSEVSSAYDRADKDDVWLARSAARRRLLGGYPSWGRLERALRYLRDEDKVIRLQAIWFLRNYIADHKIEDRDVQIDEQVIDSLIERLRDPDGHMITAEAITLLAYTKHPKAVRALIQFKEKAPIWTQTVNSALGEYAKFELERALSDGPVEEILPLSKPAPIDHGNIGEFISLATTGDEAGKLTGILGLCWISDPRVEEIIAAATKDPSPRIRYAAVFALDRRNCVRQGSGETLETVRPLSEDPDRFVRRRAVSLLSNSGWIHPELSAECVKHRADWLETLAAISSCRYAKRPSPEFDRALLPLLTIPYDRLREAVARQVAWFCVPEQQALLQALMHDASIRVRRAAASQLGNHPSFVPLLFSALEDQDETVRLAAAQGLSRYGRTSALAPLEQLAESDPSELVRVIAKQTIQQISSRAALTEAEQDEREKDLLERAKLARCK